MLKLTQVHICLLYWRMNFYRDVFAYFAKNWKQILKGRNFVELSIKSNDIPKCSYQNIHFLMSNQLQYHQKKRKFTWEGFKILKSTKENLKGLIQNSCPTLAWKCLMKGFKSHYRWEKSIKKFSLLMPLLLMYILFFT